MFGSEPIIRYQNIGACARSDAADEVPERLGGSPVEPAAMHVNDRGSPFDKVGTFPPRNEKLGLEYDYSLAQRN